MPHFYAVRRFSSWSFRLSISVALLLSSVGLAASLLAGAVAHEAGSPGAAWQPLAYYSHPASKLSAAPFTYAEAPPGAPSSAVSAYAFTTAAAYDAPPSQPAPSVAAAAAAAPLPEASSVKATVLRSWFTFKQAFR